MHRLAARRGKFALTLAIVLFTFAVSACFQTVDASVAGTTAVSPSPSPLPPQPEPLPTDTPLPAPVAPVSEAPVAVAQEATFDNGVFPGGPETTQTVVMATLYAQATAILQGVTETAAVEQTMTATALGTFPADPNALPPQPAVDANGQPILITVQPGITNVTAVPAGTPGAPGSGAAGPLDNSCVYTVVDGDRIFRIALRFGMDPDTLARANGIVNPELISVGQRIRIPVANCPIPRTPTPVPTIAPTAIPTQVPGGPTAIPGTPVIETLPGGTLVLVVTATPNPANPTPLPAGSQTYVVQNGDTLFSIALRFNVRVNAIAQANNISNINLIYQGQTLIIP
jgi:LysM repeat protein